MNRKGFTLVELFTTIVVLSIVALITVPIVIGSLDQAKKSAFNANVYGMIRSADVDSSNSNEERREYTVEAGVLKYNGVAIGTKGSFEGDGLIELDDSGRIAVVLGNSLFCAKKTFLKEGITVTEGPCDDLTEIPLDDLERPLITLIGSNPVNVVLGDSYTDQGANVTDNIDPSRTISGSGSVNVNVIGAYTITFNTTDVYGNSALEVTRTVNVIDNVAPVITLNGASSIEIEKGTSYTDLGASVTDNYDATRSISGSGSVNINQAGTYTITFNTTDSSGNAATEVTRTVTVVETFTVNPPVLADSMIPIEWDGSKWVKADSDWYDYANKKWANTVITSPASRSGYQSASAGTQILEADVLMYYVWIPRFKFAVPSGSGPREISIIFEQGTATTGTGNGTGTSYYTHPGFTYDAKQQVGFWVGKFETGKKQAGDQSTWTTAGAQGSPGSNLVLVKPNIYSWRNNNVSTEYNLALNVATDTDYGINSSAITTHMSNNTEWGAISYLSHSMYGTCTAGVCTEVMINNSSGYLTGCAATNAPTAGSGSYTDHIPGCQNQYHTTNGQKASTTGNIYGVYDMVGAAYEHTFAHITNYAASTGFTTTFLSGTEAAKYINKYTSGSVGILGDAGATDLTESWYNDFGPSAVFNLLNSWYRRGGDYLYGNGCGMFYYNSLQGPASTYGTWRMILREL